jgi:hypothetical protein
MKRCPKCGQGYTESDINFCLNDGELLMQYTPDEPKTILADDVPTRFADDSPPTVMMDPGRMTNQTSWPQSSPPAAWQSSTPAMQNQGFGVGGFTMAQDKTLPTIALVLGVGSAIMVCCYGGIWLGVPAAIVGFIGMRNADSDPTRYSGRGLAVGGMVLGIVTFLISMVILVFGLLANAV